MQSSPLAKESVHLRDVFVANIPALSSLWSEEDAKHLAPTAIKALPSYFASPLQLVAHAFLAVRACELHARANAYPTEASSGQPDTWNALFNSAIMLYRCHAPTGTKLVCSDTLRHHPDEPPVIVPGPHGSPPVAVSSAQSISLHWGHGKHGGLSMGLSTLHLTIADGTKAIYTGHLPVYAALRAFGWQPPSLG